MKLVSSIFALLMFVVLFVAPLALSVIQEDSTIVLQEFEDSNDAEEGEDLNLKEVQEKHFWATSWSSNKHIITINIQVHLDSHKYIFTSQLLGVETPPPRLA